MSKFEFKGQFVPSALVGLNIKDDFVARLVVRDTLGTPEWIAREYSLWKGTDQEFAAFLISSHWMVLNKRDFSKEPIAHTEFTEDTDRTLPVTFGDYVARHGILSDVDFFHSDTLAPSIDKAYIFSSEPLLTIYKGTFNEATSEQTWENIGEIPLSKTAAPALLPPE